MRIDGPDFEIYSPRIEAPSPQVVEEAPPPPPPAAPEAPPPPPAPEITAEDLNNSPEAVYGRIAIQRQDVQPEVQQQQESNAAPPQNTEATEERHAVPQETTETRSEAAAPPSQEPAEAKAFDEQAYMEANPDVAQEIRKGAFGGSALNHYLEYGMKEGRALSMAQPENNGETPPEGSSTENPGEPPATPAVPKTDEDLKNDEINRRLGDAINYKEREIEDINNRLAGEVSEEERAQLEKQLENSKKEVTTLQSSGGGANAAQNAMRTADQVFANESRNLDERLKAAEDPVEKAALEAEKRMLERGGDFLMGEVDPTQLEVRQNQRKEEATNKLVEETLQQFEEEKAEVQKRLESETDEAQRAELEKQLQSLETNSKILQSRGAASELTPEQQALQDQLNALDESMNNSPYSYDGDDSRNQLAQERARLQQELSNSISQGATSSRNAVMTVLAENANNRVKNLERRLEETTDPVERLQLQQQLGIVQQDADARLQEADPNRYEAVMKERDAKTNETAINDAREITQKQIEETQAQLAADPENKDAQAQLNKLQQQLGTLNGDTQNSQFRDERIQQLEAELQNTNSLDDDMRRQDIQSELSQLRSETGSATVAAQKAALDIARQIREEEAKKLEEKLKDENLSDLERAQIEMDLSKKQQDADTILRQTDRKAFDERQQQKLADVNEKTMERALAGNNQKIEALKQQLETASDEEKASLQKEINSLRSENATVQLGIDGKSEKDRIQGLQMAQQLIEERLVEASKKLRDAKDPAERLQILNEMSAAEGEFATTQQEQVIIDPLQDMEIKEAVEEAAAKLKQAAKDNKAKDSKFMEEAINDTLQLAASNPKLAAALADMLGDMKTGTRNDRKLNAELDKLSKSINAFSTIDPYANNRDARVQDLAEDFQKDLSEVAKKPRSFWSKFGSAMAIAGAAALTVATAGMSTPLLVMTIAGASISAVNQFVDNKWLGYIGTGLSMGAGIGAAIGGATSAFQTGFQVAKGGVNLAAATTDIAWLDKLSTGMNIADFAVGGFKVSGSNVGEKALDVSSQVLPAVGSITGNKTIQIIGSAATIANAGVNTPQGNPNQPKPTGFGQSNLGRALQVAVPTIGQFSGNQLLRDLSTLGGAVIGKIGYNNTETGNSGILGALKDGTKKIGNAVTDFGRTVWNGITNVFTTDIRDVDKKYIETLGQGLNLGSLDEKLKSIDTNKDLNDKQKAQLREDVIKQAAVNTQIEQEMQARKMRADLEQQLKAGLDAGTISEGDFVKAAGLLYGYDPSNPDTLGQLPEEYRDIAADANKQLQRNALGQKLTKGEISVEEFTAQMEALGETTSTRFEVKNASVTTNEYFFTQETFQDTMKKMMEDGAFNGLNQQEAQRVFQAIQGEASFNTLVQNSQYANRTNVNEFLQGISSNPNLTDEQKASLAATVTEMADKNNVVLDQIASDRQAALEKEMTRINRLDPSKRAVAIQNSKVFDELLGEEQIKSMTSSARESARQVEQLKNTMDKEISDFQKLKTPEEQLAYLNNSKLLQKNMAPEKLQEMKDTLKSGIQLNNNAKELFKDAFSENVIEKLNTLTGGDTAQKKVLLEALVDQYYGTVSKLTEDIRQKTYGNGAGGTFVVNSLFGGGSAKFLFASDALKNQYNKVERMIRDGNIEGAEKAFKDLQDDFNVFTNQAKDKLGDLDFYKYATTDMAKDLTVNLARDYFTNDDFRQGFNTALPKELGRSTGQAIAGFTDGFTANNYNSAEERLRAGQQPVNTTGFFNGFSEGWENPTEGPLSVYGGFRTAGAFAPVLASTALGTALAGPYGGIIAGGATGAVYFGVDEADRQADNMYLRALSKDFDPTKEGQFEFNLGAIGTKALVGGLTSSLPGLNATVGRAAISGGLLNGVSELGFGLAEQYADTGTVNFSDSNLWARTGSGALFGAGLGGGVRRITGGTRPTPGVDGSPTSYRQDFLDNFGTRRPNSNLIGNTPPLETLPIDTNFMARMNPIGSTLDGSSSIGNIWQRDSQFSGVVNAKGDRLNFRGEVIPEPSFGFLFDASGRPMDFQGNSLNKPQGLLDFSGRPLNAQNTFTGLLDSSGRPISGSLPDLQPPVARIINNPSQPFQFGANGSVRVNPELFSIPEVGTVPQAFELQPGGRTTAHRTYGYLMGEDGYYIRKFKEFDQEFDNSIELQSTPAPTYDDLQALGRRLYTLDPSLPQALSIATGELTAKGQSYLNPKMYYSFSKLADDLEANGWQSRPDGDGVLVSMNTPGAVTVNNLDADLPLPSLQRNSFTPRVATLDAFTTADIKFTNNLSATHGELVEAFIRSKAPDAEFIRFDPYALGPKQRYQETQDNLQEIVNRVRSGERIDAVTISMQENTDITKLGTTLNLPITPDNISLYAPEIRNYYRTQNPVLSRTLDLMDELNELNVPVYIPAGNGGKNSLNLLTLSDNRHVVGATDSSGNMLPFSSNNDLIDLKQQGAFTFEPVLEDRQLLGYRIPGSIEFFFPAELAEKWAGGTFPTITNMNVYKNTPIQGTSFSTPLEIGEFLANKTKNNPGFVENTGTPWFQRQWDQVNTLLGDPDALAKLTVEQQNQVRATQRSLSEMKDLYDNGYMELAANYMNRTSHRIDSRPNFDLNDYILHPEKYNTGKDLTLESMTGVRYSEVPNIYGKNGEKFITDLDIDGKVNIENTLKHAREDLLDSTSQTTSDSKIVVSSTRIQDSAFDQIRDDLFASLPPAEAEAALQQIKNDLNSHVQRQQAEALMEELFHGGIQRPLKENFIGGQSMETAFHGAYASFKAGAATPEIRDFFTVTLKNNNLENPEIWNEFIRVMNMEHGVLALEQLGSGGSLPLLQEHYLRNILAPSGTTTPGIISTAPLGVNSIQIPPTSNLINRPAFGLGNNFRTPQPGINPLGLFDRPAFAMPDTGPFFTQSARLDRPWAPDDMGIVEISKNGDWWAKRANPNAPGIKQAWGQRTIQAQFDGLQQLGDMGPPSFMENGVLFTQDAGRSMKDAKKQDGTYSRSDFLKAWVQGSWRMGTVLNDIRPRNVATNGLIFDPAIDKLTSRLFIGSAMAAIYGATYAAGTSPTELMSTFKDLFNYYTHSSDEKNRRNP